MIKVRKVSFKNHKKTTVYLTPENAEMLEVVKRTHKNHNLTDYINHALQCFAAGRITPLPRTKKYSLPAINENRPRVKIVWAKSEFISRMGMRVPKEWYVKLTALAKFHEVPITTLIKERFNQYLADDEIDSMAMERNVPFSYMRRELLQNVFPELPLCDFGPPVRGNIKRKDQKRRVEGKKTYKQEGESPCEVSEFSSRACERGTHGCNVVHGPPIDGYQYDSNSPGHIALVLGKKIL